MEQKDFFKLDNRTQMSLIIAMHIRNEMECFHTEHLSDEQMMELNPIIRQAVYNILTYINLASTGDVAARKIIDFEIMLVPDYWELPNKNSPKQYMEELSTV